MLIKNFVIVVVLLLYTSSAFALGEIFKIETSGNEYCNDYDVTPFNANSNVDLWVRIDSETQLTVSLTPNFAPNTFFPMFGQNM